MWDGCVGAMRVVKGMYIREDIQAHAQLRAVRCAVSRADWELPMLASGCCRSAGLTGLGSEMHSGEARSDCGDEVGE